MTWPAWLRSLVHPKILVPLLLTAALFAVALSLGNIGNVIGRLQSIQYWLFGVAFAMAFAYIAIKGWLLHRLLLQLDIKPSLQRFLLAYSVGELTLTLPFGVFAQNWVLATTGDAHFGRSSAATVSMGMVEMIVMLLVLAVVGIPGWPALRPTAAVIVGMSLLAGYLALRFAPQLHELHGRTSHPLLRKGLNQLIDLINSLRILYNLRLFLVILVTTALYLGALAVAFMVIGQAMGLDHLSFITAATIYAFSLAAALVASGVVGQIGAVELIGMSAAHAFGYNFTDGLALMLGFRIVWTGSIWLISLPVFCLLWRKLKPGAGNRS